MNILAVMTYNGDDTNTGSDLIPMFSSCISHSAQAGTSNSFSIVNLHRS